MNKILLSSICCLILAGCHSMRYQDYATSCFLNKLKADNKLKNGFYAIDEGNALVSDDVIIEQLLENKEVLVPIDDIISIQADEDESDATLNIVLNRDASQKMMEHTRDNIGSSIAFIVNDKVISNARILGVLTYSFLLTGLDFQQAQDIESMFTCE